MAAEFKVPTCLPGGEKAQTGTKLSSEEETHQSVDNKPIESLSSSPVTNDEPLPELPYTEPTWSGTPPSSYKLSVIKRGVQVECINIDKPYITFGRLPICDVHLQHPSISRFHVVLQYRPISSVDTVPESTLFSTNPKDTGFYLYDLGSVHGTYLNKTKVEPRCYYRVRVGQTMKFGGSTRLFVLDQSTDSVQEIVEAEAEAEREEILQKQEEYNQLVAQAEAERIRKEQMKEALGATWGLLTEDDLATTESRQEMRQLDPQREAYYMEDPKKALKKFFEREGLELEYETEEADSPSGKMYTVRILLPIEDLSGEPIYAEGSQEAKKKEAVVKCALEACRLLDAEDILRHPMKNYKRKKRNWEENDYYDSDEDNFLDRTGDIDRKRKSRMKRVGKGEDTVETYESLMTKLTDVKKELHKLHSVLDKSTKDMSVDGDSLDAFMKNIGSMELDKQKQSEMKLRIHQLKKEEEYLQRLVKAAEPCKLPGSDISEVTSPTKLESTATSSTEMLVSTQENKTISKTKVAEEIPATKSSSNRHKLTQKVNQKCDSDNVPNKLSPHTTKKTSLIGPSLPPPTAGTDDDKTTNTVEEEEEEEEYDSWLPPENQTGDGRTSLNDKFGY